MSLRHGSGMLIVDYLVKPPPPRDPLKKDTTTLGESRNLRAKSPDGAQLLAAEEWMRWIRFSVSLQEALGARHRDVRSTGDADG